MTDVSSGPEPAVRVSKLGYVQFTTPDVDRLVDYYTKVLDFQLVEQAPAGAFLTTGFDHHSVVDQPGRHPGPVGGRLRDLGVGGRRRAPPARGRLRGGTP